MLRFTCRVCGKKGHMRGRQPLAFLQCRWYVDKRGLVHGCLYCRYCGGVHDTVGSLLGPLKMILGRLPSRVLVAYDAATFKKLLRINNHDYRTLGGLPDLLWLAMEQDGILSDSDDVFEEPTDEFLHQCLQDAHPDIRKEAEIALRRMRGGVHGGQEETDA